MKLDSYIWLDKFAMCKLCMLNYDVHYCNLHIHKIMLGSNLNIIYINVACVFGRSVNLIPK
jgi:hypothetical protein